MGSTLEMQSMTTSGTSCFRDTKYQDEVEKGQNAV